MELGGDLSLIWFVLYTSTSSTWRRVLLFHTVFGKVCFQPYVMVDSIPLSLLGFSVAGP